MVNFILYVFFLSGKREKWQITWKSNKIETSGMFQDAGTKQEKQRAGEMAKEETPRARPLV